MEQWGLLHSHSAHTQATFIASQFDNTQHVAPAHYDVPTSFDEALGNEAAFTATVVIGSNAEDHISGTFLPDTFRGTPGNDVITGGQENDTFDYQTLGFANFGASTHTLDGGTQTNDLLNPGADVLKLPGRAADYVALTQYGALWHETGITYRSSAVAGQTVLELRDIEKVKFAEKISNQVQLTAGFVDVEMLKLAGDAYGPLVTLTHGAENLAHEGFGSGALEFPYSDIVAVAASQRGWHPVQALELGLKPADYGEHRNLRYSFDDGFYAAFDTSLTETALVDRPEVNALVLTGLVNGSRTLAIAFRGTDNWADPLDWANMADHYQKFRPLIESVNKYIDDPENAIQQVLVSGHSLGAGVLQHFMHEHAGDARFRGYTDGSPGSDHSNGQGADSRIVNFIHTNDLVTYGPDITAPLVSPLGKFAGVTIGPALAGAAFALGGIGIGLGATALAGLYTTAIVKGQQKFREGSEIFLNSNISDSIGIAEHDRDTYTADLIKLHRAAEDAASPFHSTQLAGALRADAVYTGPDIYLAVGAEGSDVFKVDTRDQYDLGGPGNDAFLIDGISNPAGIFPASGLYVFDGGEGRDGLVLPGYKAADFAVTETNGVFGLKYQDQSVAILSRMEVLVFPSDIENFFVYLGNTAPNAHFAPNTDATVSAQPFSDGVVTGNGNKTVHGTTGHDRIIVGGGAQTIFALGGHDVITVVDDGGARLSIDAGEGHDIVKSGAGHDLIEGSFGDDVLDGGGGFDTARFTYAHDRYDIRAIPDLVNGGILCRVGIAPDAAGSDGADTLINFEEMRFADGLFGFSPGAALNGFSRFNGDRFDDVVIQNVNTGQVLSGQIFDGVFQNWTAITGVMDPQWKAMGIGDVDPGLVGGSEVFIQNALDGTIYYVGLDLGDTEWGVVSTNLTPEWKLRAVGDVNRDLSADAIVQNETDGTIYFAEMRGGDFRAWGVVNANLTADWVAVGAGDLNRDGYADVVVQQQSTGTTYYANMAGGVFSGWGVVSANLTADWRVKAVADLNGDGFSDVVFQNAAGGGGINPGTAYFADMKGGVFDHWTVVTASVSGEWRVQGVADVDNDGFNDVLFQNLDGGGGINPGTTYYANMGPGGFEAWGAVTTNISGEWHVV